MLSRSKSAITVNIEIMRAFVKLRQLLASNAELARRLDELESKYDKQFKIVFDAIRHLSNACSSSETDWLSFAIREKVSFKNPLIQPGYKICANTGTTRLLNGSAAQS